MGTKVKSSRNRPQPAASTITERKQVEKALSYSEQYFRPLIERALDVVVVLNSDGTIRYESPSLQNVIGYTPEERQGKSFFDLIHPDDLPKADSAFSQLLQKQVANVHIELRTRHKDGSWRHIEAVGQNLINDPAVAGIVANFRDITDRKQAEEALQKSEEYFRVLTENALDPIMILETDGTIRYESPSIQSVLGYRPKELVGKNYIDFVHPQDVPDLIKYFDHMIRKPGVIVHPEARIKHKDGSWRIIQGATKNLSDNPVVKGIVVNFRDVTERKQAEEVLRESEERYRLLAENVRDVITSTDICRL